MGVLTGSRYVPRAIAPSRVNRRVHALADWLEVLVDALGAVGVHKGQADQAQDSVRPPLQHVLSVGNPTLRGEVNGWRGPAMRGMPRLCSDRCDSRAALLGYAHDVRGLAARQPHEGQDHNGRGDQPRQDPISPGAW